MSWGMNMGTHLKIEMSVTIGEWVFEIWSVNNRGWCGPGNHYDVNELEITRYPIWIFSDKAKETFTPDEIEGLKRSTGPQFFNVERIEKGEINNLTDLALYKEAIFKFRNLVAFL